MDSAGLIRFKQHLHADDVVLLGIVRQELLSGLRTPAQFEKMDTVLSGFDELFANVDDHRRAAEFYNMCRLNGVQGSAIDFLICAMAERRDLPILTSDADFVRYAENLPILLDAC